MDGVLMRCVLLLILASGLPACSSIVEGTSQQILVNTNPSGADCGLYREGLRIATIQNTPGSALVNKTKHNIWIVCVKPGFQQANHFNKSGAAAATAGNIILGGGVGWIIDSATGADNKYDGSVNISLVPASPGPTASPVGLPATFQSLAPPPAMPVPAGSPQS